MSTILGFIAFTGNQMKLIAIFLMTIDHIGALLLPQYSVLRIIGRLAMPIFAYMIAEGCHYTKNRLRYLSTMACFAVICQVVNLIFQHEPLSMNIMVTFSMSILLIYSVDYASEQKSFLSLCIMGCTFLLTCFVCVFLKNYLPWSGFRVDYGFIGVLLPVFIYMGKTKEEKLMLCACGLAALAMMNYNHQWYALLSLPILALYNGQRGKRALKYLFYIYYPLHLTVIFTVALLIK